MKIKKGVSILLVLALVLVCCPLTVYGAQVAGGSFGEGLKWTLDGAGILTVSGSGDMPDYPHPMFDGEPAEWSEHISEIKSVIIETGVTGVGSFAFRGATQLESVSLPEGLRRIATHAFADCVKLMSVDLPSGMEELSKYAFASTGWYDALGEGVAYIGEYAVTVKGAVPAELNIKDGTALIASYCFSFQPDVVSVKLPDSLRIIGSSAFNGCTGLKSIEIPGGVEKIGANCFQNCENLTSLTLSQGLKTIENTAFYGCSSLAELTVPSTLASIGEDAFYGSGLVRVTIPSGVTGIGEHAFAFCPALERIDVSEDNPVFASEDGSLYNKDKTALLAYAGGSGTRTFTLPDSVREIGAYAFSGREDITGVITTPALETIGDRAFFNCHSLGSVTLCEGLKSIGEGAFYSCKALAGMTVPQSVTHIGSLAFEGTPFMSSQSDGLVYLGKVAYIYKGYDYGLEEIGIKEGVVEIGDGCFETCPNLKKIILPDSLVRIGGMAFLGKRALSEIKIPAGVAEIGYNAFSGCTALTTAVLPKSLTKLGMGAFWNCSALKKVEFTGGPEELETQTFAECAALTDVKLPENLRSIGKNAFTNCRALETIDLPESLINVDPTAFLGCVNLKFADGQMFPLKAEGDDIIILLTLEQMQYNVHVNAKSIDEESVLVSLLDGTYAYTKAWDLSVDFGNAAIDSVEAAVELPLGSDGNVIEVYMISDGGSAEKLETGVNYEKVSFRVKKGCRIVLVNTQTKVEFERGKVDSDDLITAYDARLALRGAVNLENFPVFSREFSACDVDNNGRLEASDARSILRAAVGLVVLS